MVVIIMAGMIMVVALGKATQWPTGAEGDPTGADRSRQEPKATKKPLSK